MTGNTRISAIIAIFGGQNGAARILSVSQGTVWGWVSKNSVPSHRIPQIIRAAAALSPPVTLTPDDFFDPVSIDPEAETAVVPAKAA